MKGHPLKAIGIPILFCLLLAACGESPEEQLLADRNRAERIAEDACVAGGGDPEFVGQFAALDILHFELVEQWEEDRVERLQRMVVRALGQLC